MSRVFVPKGIDDRGFLDVDESKEHLETLIQRATAYTLIKLTPTNDDPGRFHRRPISIKASLIQAVE